MSDRRIRTDAEVLAHEPTPVSRHDGRQAEPKEFALPVLDVSRFLHRIKVMLIPALHPD